MSSSLTHVQIELEIANNAKLDVREVALVERISDLFEFTLHVLSEDASMDFEPIIGKAATVRAHSDVLGEGRTWVGVVTHAEQERAVGGGQNTEMSTYVFRVSPSLWLAKLRKNHRIFQHLSIPDIVDTVMAPYGVTAEWRIARESYPKLWQKVQYGESDFDFVSRLLEEVGIDYAFIDGTLYFGDKLVETPFGDHGTLPYQQAIEHYLDRPHSRLGRVISVPRPTDHVSIDYDLRRPAYDLEAQASAAGQPRLEQFDYTPGGFLKERGGSDDATPAADDKAVARHDQDLGSFKNQRFLEGERTGRHVATFVSNTLSAAAGTTVTIEGHPNAAFATKLLVTEMRITTTTYPGMEIARTAHFANEPYRVARRTPKPQVSGVESATVVGPSGQEIHTDEFGRVRVHFPWDRGGTKDDNATCWVRVSEGWSGAGYGLIALPRVGQEVLVAFIGGDPDSPVVVGRLHNQLNPVPYRLPEHRTVSAWRTMSSPANGGYNEIKIEDAAGQEFIYTRAQRDHHRLVLRDDRTRTERKLHHTVLDLEHRVSKSDKKELIVGTSHLHVKADGREKIDGRASLGIGSDWDIKVGNKTALASGREVHIKAGDTVVIETGAKMTLKGPGGFITIDAGGIEIVGELVRINSGGSAAAGSGSSPQAPDDAEEAEPSDTSLP